MYNEDISLCEIAAMSNFFLYFITPCDRVVPLVVSLPADIYDEKIK